MRVLNVDGIYKPDLPLTGDKFTVKTSNLEIEVPLLFNPNVTFTEEMKKINLRWVMVCLTWVKAYKNIKVAKGFSPLFKEYVPVNVGLTGEWDVLGVAHLESEFHTILDISRAASRAYSNPGIPITCVSEVPWVNQSIFYDYGYTQDFTPVGSHEEFTCVGGRKLLGRKLEEFLSIKGKVIVGGFEKYAELANLMTERSYLSKARELMYDSFISEDDMFWSRQMAFVIVAKHEDGVLDSFNTLWVSDSVIDIRMKNYAGRLYFDPNLNVKNTFLFFYLIEASVGKNLDIDVMKYNKTVSDIGTASYIARTNVGSAFNKSMWEFLEKTKEKEISPFVEFQEYHSDSYFSTRLPIKREGAFANYVNTRFVDAWFHSITNGLTDYGLPEAVNWVRGEDSLSTQFGDQSSPRVVSDAVAYLPIPYEILSELTLEEQMALTVIARYIGYAETQTKPTSVQYKIDKRYKYSYVNERLFDDLSPEEITWE